MNLTLKDNSESDSLRLPTPCLPADSRQSISVLYGSAYDEERYNAVVQQCGLERDFALFDAGDATEVGGAHSPCTLHLVDSPIADESPPSHLQRRA